MNDSIPNNHTPNSDPMMSEAHIDRILQDRFESDPVRENMTSDQLVDELVGRAKNGQQDGTIVVSVIGGAASGKTTLSDRITDTLRSHGLTSERISTDDYGRGTREWRHKEFGTTGRDQLEKYDFKHLNDRISRIKSIDDHVTKVPVPTYDDSTGESTVVGEDNYSRQIGQTDVLIVEGDFDQVDESDLRIYLHVPDSQRMATRVDRDTKLRGEADSDKVEASFIERQHTQHAPHTLPASEQADLLVIADASTDDWQYMMFESARPN
jgi:uridine kinase